MQEINIFILNGVECQRRINAGGKLLDTRLNLLFNTVTIVLKFHSFYTLHTLYLRFQLLHAVGYEPSSDPYDHHSPLCVRFHINYLISGKDIALSVNHNLLKSAMQFSENIQLFIYYFFL